MRHSGKLVRALVVLSLAYAATGRATSAQLSLSLDKLDPVLQQNASLLTGQSRIVARAAGTTSLDALTTLILSIGGVPGRRLPIVNGEAAIVPNTSLLTLAASTLVLRLSVDRLVVGALERTGATIGATALHQSGYDGSGIGIAVIDSGITAWHDDLAGTTAGTQRVDRFVDFVDGRTAAYDDYGHGTHVAGIIAGNGFDSSGARAGIAPAAHLTVLKALDASGKGRISDVIAAMDYVLEQRSALNIRVVNLSIAAPVFESYNLDPLTLAAQRLVSAGVTVVAAAGNNGRGPDGTTQYGGITSPGNAPWVLTVGASSHMGTIDRADDTIAAFSSRGASAVDANAKPDVVAPGVGIESLSDPDSALYSAYPAYLLPGTVPTSYLPYLSLSGTSMATPVVAGTVALMLQANPDLTPNLVKAILEYTSQVYPGYDALTQGAGFLNANGAVALARYLTGTAGGYPDASGWSGRLIWGNYLVQGGTLTAAANAWRATMTWGEDKTRAGQPVTWGETCSGGTCSRWGASCAGLFCTTVSYGSAPNVVWGSTCSGANCLGTWTGAGQVSGAIVVWGTSDEGDIVVWGTACTDPSCTPVIWTSR